MERAYLLRTMWDNVGQKNGRPKPFENLGKQAFPAGPKKKAARSEHGDPEMVENLAKTSKIRCGASLRDQLGCCSPQPGTRGSARKSL